MVVPSIKCKTHAHHIIELLLVLHVNASNNDIATEARQTKLTVLTRNSSRHSKVGIELTTWCYRWYQRLACPVNHRHNHLASAVEGTAVVGAYHFTRSEGI